MRQVKRYFPFGTSNHKSPCRLIIMCTVNLRRTLMSSFIPSFSIKNKQHNLEAKRYWCLDFGLVQNINIQIETHQNRNRHIMCVGSGPLTSCCRIISVPHFDIKLTRIRSVTFTRTFSIECAANVSSCLARNSHILLIMNFELIRFRHLSKWNNCFVWTIWSSQRTSGLACGAQQIKWK